MPTPLSAQVHGLPVVVDATNSPGTFLHQAVVSTNMWDEIYMYAYSVAGSDAASIGTDLTIEWGGADSSNHIIVNIEPSSGPVLLTPGLLLNFGKSIRAFAPVQNVIKVYGFVYRGGV